MENETMQPNTPVEQSPIQVAPQKTSTSGIIGTVIIIALIILGGLYFWGKRINTQKEMNTLIQQEQQSTQEATTIEAVSESDEASTIQAELEVTQTTGLGAELE